jgi:cyclopropane fatty-acyl-phospholipid synthase-like methyltransferase
LFQDKSLFAPKMEVLVPGAGHGHDAIALAKAGCIVSTVDISPLANQALLLQASAEKISVQSFHQDFFSLSAQGYHQERYDRILEYTFFCAIAPSLRASYVEHAAKLLKKGGALIGLFFPTDGRAGGPPFAVNRKEVEALFSPHFHLEIGEPTLSVKPRAGKEFLGIFRKI